MINKRAGGTGTDRGPQVVPAADAEGVELIHAVQDVFLDESITIA